MRFLTPWWRANRQAKRLKKALKLRGRDLPYKRCLDLTARICGLTQGEAR